jgi:predicted RNase H-like nuclease (RuvC/YqgF family)
MANLLRMPKPAPPRTPEREALAAAIARHNNAVREFDATERALRETKARIYHDDNAAEAVEKAKAAVESAKVNAAKHMTESLLGKAGEAPVSIQEARRALQNAEDELEALQAVKATLQARFTACESELDWAKRHLRDRVRDVVCSEPGIRNLLTKFEAAKKDLEQRHLDLRWFSRQFMIPDEYKNWDLEGIRHEPQPDALSDLTAPWAAAIERLAIDADAPLPTS